jgi:hypothetical protein
MAHLRASIRGPRAAFDDTLATVLPLRRDIRSDCRPVCRSIDEADKPVRKVAVETLDKLADYPDLIPLIMVSLTLPLITARAHNSQSPMVSSNAI